MPITAFLEKEKAVHSFIETHARSFNIDPDLVRALISAESAFNGNAVSPTGAVGWGQFTAIGAEQVRLICSMTDKAKGLESFTKSQASDPDKGIKAICAFLWWLFFVRHKNVKDDRIRLEACLTFYNAGGKAANLVITHGGHANALGKLKDLPAKYRSQSTTYAPKVIKFYEEWKKHSLLKVSTPTPAVSVSPSAPKLGENKKILIKSLEVLGEISGIKVSKETRQDKIIMVIEFEGTL